MEADEDIAKELNKYLTVSSFSTIDCTGQLSKKYLKRRRDQLILELEILYTDTERIRNGNAISFLHFLIGDVELAFEVNKTVLECAPDNITAISNHARFLHMQQEGLSRVKKDCEKLSELCKDPYKTIIAKSEVAFTFLIFGTMFAKKAGQLFQEVITECVALAQDNTNLSEDFEVNFNLWLFGCTLAYKRLLNIRNVHKKAELDLSKQTFKIVGQLCRDIIARENQSRVSAIFSARAYVLLGELANDLRGKRVFPNGIKDVLPDNPELHMKVEDYLEKALSTGHGDSCVFVLERCGKQFRYANQIDRSIELLKKAIEIKPTGLNHHHLALTLKRKLEDRCKPTHQKGRVGRTNSHQRKADETEAVTQATDPEMRGMTIHQSPSVGSSKSDKDDSVDCLEKLTLNHSKNDQIENPPGSAESFSPYQRYIKSPRTYKKIDTSGQEDLLKSIETHLDKSFEINMNVSALYDKGLLKMQTGQLEEAIKIFKRVMKDEHEQCSHVVVANAYEQAGLCLDELLCRPDCYSREDEEDMVMYFKKSIEISCNIVAKVPALQACWSSVPTLLSFLKRQIETKNVLKDLDFLYRKVKDYGSDVKVLNKLLELAEDEGEKTELVHKLIKSYMENKCIDDAVLAFDFIKCFPEWQERVDKELYVTVQIEGAFYALKMGENNVARLRFENAFDFCKRTSVPKGRENTTEPKQENEDTEREGYDIFLLYNPDNDKTDSNATKLQEELGKLGLSVTRNTEDVIGGMLRLEGIAEIMKMSKHFIVLFDKVSIENVSNKELIFYASVMKEIVSDRQHGNVMVLVPTNFQNSDLPKVFAGYDKICFDFDSEDRDGLKPLLTRLAMGRE